MKDNLRYVTEVGIGNWTCPECDEDCEVESTVVYKNCEDRETGLEYQAIKEATDKCTSCGCVRDNYMP